LILNSLLNLTPPFELLESGGGGSGAVVWLRQASKDLAPIYQGSGPTDVWTILDSSSDPVDLFAQTIRFVAGEVADESDPDNRYDDTLEGLYQYETGTDDNITIGGDSGNEVTVRHLPANTATAGVFRYWLWDVTTTGQEVVLASGKLVVKPAIKAV
jgi:hypothetical protein